MHGNDRDSDFGKNIGRHRADDDDAEKQDKRRQHIKRVREISAQIEQCPWLSRGLFLNRNAVECPNGRLSVSIGAELRPIVALLAAVTG